MDYFDEESLAWRDVDVALNAQNEEKALSKLQSICDESLKRYLVLSCATCIYVNEYISFALASPSRYPTDLSDDILALKADTPGMSKTQRNALTLVKSEKEVLSFYWNVSAFGMTVLAAVSESQFESLLHKSKRSYPHFVTRYCDVTLRKLRNSRSPTVSGERADFKGDVSSGGSMWSLDQAHVPQVDTPDGQAKSTKKWIKGGKKKMIKQPRDDLSGVKNILEDMDVAGENGEL